MTHDEEAQTGGNRATEADGGATFQLRFPASELADWSQRYLAGLKEAERTREMRIERKIAPSVRRARYLTRNQFLEVCYWKSPRTSRACERNDDGWMRIVSGVALSTPDERLRIEILTLLHGVGWPAASVILHWCHRDPYPILDFRALWSLGYESPPPYDFGFWSAYTAFCRKLANRHALSMRHLDRALWQYSKERQGSSAPAPEERA